jgi:hypothetical protein
MDAERFDDLLRRLTRSSGTSRRALLAGFAGGLVAALGVTLSGDDADAKRRRYRGRRKRRSVRRRCVPNCANKTCGGDGCGGSCGTCGNNRICLNGTCVCRLKDCDSGLCCPASAQQCCPPTTQEPIGSCAPSENTCCDSDEGGRSCPPGFPQCCKATTQNPRGLCLQSDEGCCDTDQGGGWCEADTPKCCPRTTVFPAGTCCTNDQPCCDDSGACEGELVCDAGCCVAAGTLRAQGGGSSHARQDGALRPKP